MPNFKHLKDEGLSKRLLMQSDLLFVIHRFFQEQKFVHIFTPTISFPTKEYGDGEFLVISKLQPGKFYSLPHSPQLYKQYIIATMGKAIPRYYQIASNFRPEVGDATHGQEFHQIDFEIANATVETLKETIEGVVSVACGMVQIQPQYNTISYQNAIYTYGTNYPDLRYKKAQLTHADHAVSFSIPMTDFSNFDAVKYLAAQWKEISVTQDFSSATFTAPRVAMLKLGSFRNILIARQLVNRETEWSFVWLVDLPLFILGDDGCLRAFHHPQMAPSSATDFQLAMENKDIKALLELKGQGCDLIVNGMELAGGNVRNSDHLIQKNILNIIGIQNSEINTTYKPLLTLLKKIPDYRSGGAAIGFDRLILLLTNSISLAQNNAFPLNANGEEFFGGPFALSLIDSALLHIDQIHSLLVDSQMTAARAIPDQNKMFREKFIVLMCNSLLPDEIFCFRIASHWHEARNKKSPNDKKILTMFREWVKNSHLPKKYALRIETILAGLSGYRKNKDSKIIDLLSDAKVLAECETRMVSIQNQKYSKDFSKARLLLQKIVAGFLAKLKTEIAKDIFKSHFLKTYFLDVLSEYSWKKSRNLIVLGGAESISGAYKELDQAIIALFAREKANFLYLPLAMFLRAQKNREIAEYSRKVKNYIHSFDNRIKFTAVDLENSESDIVKKISEASIIYLSGGDTLSLVERLQGELGIALIKAYTRGTLVIGNSAGALALAATSFSFAYDIQPTKIEGIGLIQNYSFLVHWSEVKAPELQTLKETNPNIQFITLEDSEAAVFSNEQLIYLHKKNPSA